MRRTLIARHIADAAHLAGSGTGADGILIGGAVARPPELFRAALIRFGAKALRQQFSADGAPNLPEVGSVADPAVPLTADASDARVPVRESAKMTARLQRASRGGRPVLLRVEFDGGGGAVRARRDAEAADEQAFLLWQMGESEDKPPTP